MLPFLTLSRSWEELRVQFFHLDYQDYMRLVLPPVTIPEAYQSAFPIFGMITFAVYTIARVARIYNEPRCSARPLRVFRFSWYVSFDQQLSLPSVKEGRGHGADCKVTVA